jgi:8-oxo-dGTP pyrophosphatase MutT (NUDIX family)
MTPAGVAAWTHAGGVVYRGEPGDRRLLLVRGTRPPHEWVLPKGHIEAGETAIQAAVREVREEAGVEAEPVQFLGEVEFTIAGEQVRSAFYLMAFSREVGGAEDRGLTWCTLTEALALTPFENAREIILAAEPFINAQ